MMSRRVVKRVLLAKCEPFYLLPTNMFLQLSAQFSDLLVELFPKDIPQGLPSITGIEHQIDFTLGASLPNINLINRDIQDIVALHHYATVDDLVHQETRGKAQQKRHLTSRKTYPSGPNSWRGKEKEKERQKRDKSPKKGEERTLPSLSPTSKSSNIKCFKCLGKGHKASQYPNKRSMIMQEDRTIDNDSFRT
ncbi:hypothetical protein CR513_39099, partial [Mucuna pruriens]